MDLENVSYEQVKKVIFFNDKVGDTLYYNVTSHFLFDLSNLDLKNQCYFMTTLQSSTLNIQEIKKTTHQTQDHFIYPEFKNKVIQRWYDSITRDYEHTKLISKRKHKVINNMKELSYEQWLEYIYS